MTPAEVKLLALNPSVKNWPVLAGLGFLTLLTGLVGMVILAFSVQTAILVAAAGIGLAAWPVLAAANTEYYVTNLRVVRSVGLLRRREQALPVSQIAEIRVVRTSMQEALGVGDLELVFAGGVLRLHGLDEPDQIRERILSLK